MRFSILITLITAILTLIPDLPGIIVAGEEPAVSDCKCPPEGDTTD